MSGAPALAVEQLHKRFGATQALAGVSFAVRPGTIHGLVGENGAGKSTLIRCLAGVHQPDSGTIRIGGRPTRLGGPRAAGALGLAFVHQELSLVPYFDAAENAVLGEPYPTRFGLVDRNAMRRAVAAVLADIAPDLPLDRPVRRLTVGERQIVMDEPTAALGATEADRLHVILRRLAGAGAAVLYVSHRLADVLSLCARVTVLRDGQTVFDGAAAGLDERAIVSHMSGGRPQRPTSRTVADASGAPRSSPVLALQAVALRAGRPGLDLTLRPGEIVGLYGLLGAGRSRLLKTVWGVHRPAAGRVLVGGAPLRPGSIRAALAAGLAFVPEERRSEGLVLGLPVAAHLSLPHLSSFRPARWLPWPVRRQETDNAIAVVRRLAIKLGDLRHRVAALSGGNQQKVVVGRWLRRPPLVLLLDEPTRGVDVGAKADLHAALRALATQGTAILFATSDLDELLALADRIGLMREGAWVGELPAQDSTAATVLSHLFGAGPEAAA